MLPVVLDGYHRTAAQLNDFASRGGSVELVAFLEIEDELAIERIGNRFRTEDRVGDVAAVARFRIKQEREAIRRLLAEAVVSEITLRLNSGGCSPDELCQQIMQWW